MNEVSRIRVGTSGWHYKHWINRFYPAGLPPGKMLSWYADHFNTVEINNTFYRLPGKDALLQWRLAVPPDFLFSVKASRFITHMKRLRDPESSIENFFSRIEALRPSLGPILFQLPPRWRINVARLEHFLEALPKNAGYQYVLEFRDASWAAPALYQLMQRHNVALCLHDWQGASWPEELTADFAYLRFHGPTGNYSGKYPDSFLEKWAEKISSWPILSCVWVYFNNDAAGHAVTNAQTMCKLLQQKGIVRERAA
ncbi:MAG: DUF72 domain-containing protein [Terriglobales bacterium]